jgi:hypothetical protein
MPEYDMDHVTISITIDGSTFKAERDIEFETGRGYLVGDALKLAAQDTVDVCIPRARQFADDLIT